MLKRIAEVLTKTSTELCVFDKKVSDKVQEYANKQCRKTAVVFFLLGILVTVLVQIVF